MNATSISELRQSLAQREGQDERMELVRQLLFGEVMQELNLRLAGIEARQRDLDQAMARQLEAISARINALAADLEASRRSSFEQLSRSLLDLGEQVRGLAKI